MLRLAEAADVFLEAFRPGVVERLGVGPDDVLARNPRIVYGRLTGWGQDGPLAIDGRPLAQLRGDHRRDPRHRPARGAAVDRAADPRRLRRRRAVAGLRRGLRAARGAAVRAGARWSTPRWSTAWPRSRRSSTAWRPSGMHTEARARTSSTAARRSTTSTRPPTASTCRWPRSSRTSTPCCWTARASPGEDLPDQYDRPGGPSCGPASPRCSAPGPGTSGWRLLEGTDACFAPVLDFNAARAHPQMAARLFPDGGTEVPPVPHLSVTPGVVGESPRWPGCDTDVVLEEAGFSAEEIGACGLPAPWPDPRSGWAERGKDGGVGSGRGSSGAGQPAISPLVAGSRPRSVLGTSLCSQQHVGVPRTGDPRATALFHHGAWRNRALSLASAVLGAAICS